MNCRVQPPTGKAACALWDDELRTAATQRTATPLHACGSHSYGRQPKEAEGQFAEEPPFD
jgi:hypothetical protein